MDRKEITLIVGPRQAGKTTLMNLLQEELIKKGEKTLFMSLDFERDMPFFRSQQALIERLSLEFGSQRVFVFVDEIQERGMLVCSLKAFMIGIVPLKTCYGTH